MSDIRDMPYVTVEEVSRLRDEAIKQINDLYAALEAIMNQPNCRYEVEAQLGDEMWKPLAKARGESDE